jgi:hypothetical protein
MAPQRETQSPVTAAASFLTSGRNAAALSGLPDLHSIYGRNEEMGADKDAPRPSSPW